MLGNWIGRRNIPRRFRNGVPYHRKIRRTGYSLGRAIEANVGLAGAVTRSRGGETAGRHWHTAASPAVPAAFEQWPLVATDSPQVTASAASGAGRTVAFRVEASDHDGIRDVWWSFGDLDSARGTEVAHAYRAPGSYRVIVWVSDRLGQTTVRELGVTVG